MGISLANVIIILFIVLILFGAGRLPKVMGDLGKGIKNFKNALKEESSTEDNETKQLSKEEKKDNNKD
ncbi:MAG: twin-arginine translocase TatA/TatE family subunit [Rickettsiales bacterium]|nr:twin-arginine translocase TatA/TatE family subunit [Rickettsiales bacterium]